MEANPVEAVRNNALATRVMARDRRRRAASRRSCSSRPTRRSRPATVMGASKALAEWAVEAADARYPSTRSRAVRFGNVLGSSGSVVPIFRRQIAAGGPVTVTDPEMTRFFMTIPEAVQLVIRAGSLASGGEVFVLEMGEPVRILDLAEDMIRFSGLEPGRDIAIEIIGPRPGEKLHEELFNAYERPEPTPAQKILRADRPAVDPAWVEDDVRPDRPARRSRATRPVWRPPSPQLASLRLESGEPSPDDVSRGRGRRRGQRLDSPLRSMVVLLAFSLQDQVEKYGAYVGIAAFFGLAVLSLLYFAQAREVKRLREWAGRAPERAARSRRPCSPRPRRAPRPRDAGPGGPAGRAAAVAVRAPVAADQRRGQAQPEEVAALAFARAAGVHEPHEPKAHPAPDATDEAPPAEVAAAASGGRRRRARRRPGAQRRQRPLAHRPAPATPAARRAERPAAAPASAASRQRRRPPSQRPAAAARGLRDARGHPHGGHRPHRDRAARSSSSPWRRRRRPGRQQHAEGRRRPRRRAAESTKTPTPAPTKETALIAIFNGTTQGAWRPDPRPAQDRRLREKNLGGRHRPAAPDLDRHLSPRRQDGARAGRRVARHLRRAAARRRQDAADRELATKWDVVVIIGNDKAN